MGCQAVARLRCSEEYATGVYLANTIQYKAGGWQVSRATVNREALCVDRIKYDQIKRLLSTILGLDSLLSRVKSKSMVLN